MEPLSKTKDPVGGKVQVWAQRDPHHDRVKVFITRYEQTGSRVEGIKWASQYRSPEGWVDFAPHEQIEPVISVAAADLIGGERDALLGDIQAFIASVVPTVEARV